MKKTLLLMAALVGMGVAVMAQEPAKSSLNAETALKKANTMNQQSRMAADFTTSLDSVVYMSPWDNYSNAYQYDWLGRNTMLTCYSEYGIERMVYNYEGDFLATVEYWSSDSGVEWSHNADEIYTYDANGNLILFEYNAFNFGEWGITDRFEYEYDEQNRITQEITWWYDFWAVEPQLVLSSMMTYAYEDNTITVDMYYYDEESQQWQPSSRLVDTLSPFGDVAIDLQMMWNEELQQFVESAKNVNEYDEEGHIISVGYSSMTNGEWVLESLFEAEYNTMGQLVNTTNSDIWMTGELEPYTHDEYEYDAYGNRAGKTAYYNSDGVMTMNSVYECVSDDVPSDEIMGCQAVWDSQVGGYFTCAADREDVLVNTRWFIFTQHDLGSEEITTIEPHYSATTSVDENGNDVIAKIYGTEGKVVVNCDTPVAISIFDMAGRQVVSCVRSGNCEINLLAGIYVVKAGEAAVKVVVR